MTSYSTNYRHGLMDGDTSILMYNPRKARPLITRHVINPDFYRNRRRLGEHNYDGSDMLYPKCNTTVKVNVPRASHNDRDVIKDRMQLAIAEEQSHTLQKPVHTERAIYIDPMNAVNLNEDADACTELENMVDPVVAGARALNRTINTSVITEPGCEETFHSRRFASAIPDGTAMVKHHESHPRLDSCGFASCEDPRNMPTAKMPPTNPRVAATLGSECMETTKVSDHVLGDNQPVPIPIPDGSLRKVRMMQDNDTQRHRVIMDVPNLDLKKQTFLQKPVVMMRGEESHDMIKISDLSSIGKTISKKSAPIGGYHATVDSKYGSADGQLGTKPNPRTNRHGMSIANIAPMQLSDAPTEIEQWSAPKTSFAR